MIFKKISAFFRGRRPSPAFLNAINLLQEYPSYFPSAFSLPKPTPACFRRSFFKVRDFNLKVTQSPKERENIPKGSPAQEKKIHVYSCSSV